MDVYGSLEESIKARNIDARKKIKRQTIMYIYFEFQQNKIVI